MALALALLVFPVGLLHAEPYSSVASFWDLGVGARPLALGEAFTGLADDGSALFYNPAALAWISNTSAASSAEMRPAAAAHGHLTACLRRFAFGVHYFDFGEIPQTDEFGNVIGLFSYRNCGLLAGAGISAADVPLLADMRLAGCVALGASAKLFLTDTMEPGNGHGLSMDLSFLLRVENPWFGQPFLDCVSFGALARNFLATEIVYQSGHREAWQKTASLGISLRALERFTVSAEARTSGSMHVGLEWTPVPVLSLRCGVKQTGIWMWSIGLGASLDRYSLDYALVTHPYLAWQHRATLEVSW